MSSPKILLAGGGTGGHVFPMIAVADALRALKPELAVEFVGTPKGLESHWVPRSGYPLRLVEILPLRGGGLGGVVRGAFRAARVSLAERRLLGQDRPSAVFSIGGYAAGPVAAAARSLGVPVALMEPNSAIGLANRWMAPFVQRAYTAFAGAERHFAPELVLRTGVPIRAEFQPRPYAPGAPLRVLVLGGSQGASSLNEVLPEAFSRLALELSVVHQCGPAHAQGVLERYRRSSGRVQASVVPFIEDMPGALAGADLVVSRSGASAVSEICAVGRPSLLVPYPYAAGDHQRLNARALEQEGASVCVDPRGLSVAKLVEMLGELLADPARLGRMARRAGALGRPEAARLIALDLLALAGLPADTAHHAPEPPPAPAGGERQPVTLGRLGSLEAR